MKKVMLFPFALVVGFLFSTCNKEISVKSIELNVKTLTLGVGESQTLKVVKILPDDATDKSYSWTNSNPSVASFYDGTVTALKVGTTTITATATTSGVTATCTVVVSETNIPVISIALDKTSLSLNTGEYYSLIATVKPDNATNKTVTWTSNNTSSVTVDNNGKVSAIGTGEAVITAKAGDKTATCMVKVTTPNLYIKLDKNSLELIVDEEWTLNATTTPAGQPVTWTSSNTSKATVEGSYSQGKVITKAPGTVTISAKYNGEIASCDIIIFDASSDVTIEGITWAANNINAPGTTTEKIFDRGMYYQWNSKIGYTSVTYDNPPSGTTWSPENDPSPSGWRIPTRSEMEKLLSKAIKIEGSSCRYAKLNNQTCFVMKFENDKHLVFPFGDGGALHFDLFRYWTSTPYESDWAYYLSYKVVSYVESLYIGSGSRKDLHMIRCVKK